MTSLKSLNFTTLPKTDSNPITERRIRTIARLEEQKLLLKDANYVRKVRSFVKKDGIRTSVENEQRVAPACGWFLSLLNPIGLEVARI